MSKPTIAIIGRGNVATHLSRALANGADIVMVNPHTLEEMCQTPDIALIAVSDNAIADVAAKLAHLDCIVAHTSGSTGIDVLRNACIRRPAVFYPLQTFSKDIDMQYADIPVFIEGDTTDIEWILTDIASIFTTHIHHADSEARRRLHLASVYACNFVNHLWTLADETLSDADYGLEVLHPLMQRTLHKALTVGPMAAQTGPARRHDTRTINAHLDIIADPLQKEIYHDLSTSIANHYERN